MKLICKYCGKEKNGRVGQVFCCLSCTTRWRYENTPFSIFVKGHKTRVGMKHPASFIEKRKGTGNPIWKGDGATVTSIHCWIRDNFKKTSICEECSKEGRTDWSNKDHTYKRVREDWQELCRGCHQRYDYANGLRAIPYSRKKKNPLIEELKG